MLTFAGRKGNPVVLHHTFHTSWEQKEAVDVSDRQMLGREPRGIRTCQLYMVDVLGVSSTSSVPTSTHGEEASRHPSLMNTPEQ